MLEMRVKVKPNARVSTLAQAADGSWIAQLKAPPVDGKANAELVALVAAHFGCPKSAVTIRSGASGRLKRIRVALPPALRCDAKTPPAVPPRG